MADTDHVRLARIADKLAAARARPVPQTAFGADAHLFELAPPVPEAVVAEFEERHKVALPPAYRLFITELGAEGAGPGYRLCRLDTACCTHRRSDHLARPSPYLPGPRYLDDWELRYEDPPGPNRHFLPGTLRIAAHGCSLVTRLIVTGPAQGRLINLDDDGPVGPYVVEDADFLAWYERWLDESAAGYDVGWFGERLPLDEPELLAVLSEDPSPSRRSRAGESLLRLPALSDTAWSALLGAISTDAAPSVRAELWDQLRWERHKHQRTLANAEEIANNVARHARSSTPRDLNALSTLRDLTFADVQPELASGDVERRRRAAYELARSWTLKRDDLQQDQLEGAVSALLDEEDPLLRAHGVAAVRRFGLTDFHPRLRALRQTETDPWVRHELEYSLGEHPARIWDAPTSPAMQGEGEGYCKAPPF
ncbi:HEAT repeat domain-containing protein [Actinomadura sp. WMMB 499]|uniref:HEAT repeat domain-containing protein n=1 Tax=Actinomadura sp. WMMB 499 TaxID=1219491 RepID=UPI0012491EEA|nr:HEAT repeat domain-containing protein [Actinomadura sp. WMMB 499]QFG22709.1 HEAT repeat domain-containing protein [Actinomadura sp. WMMB 499]